MSTASPESRKLIAASDTRVAAIVASNAQASRIVLTAAERLRGWCVYSCPRHGDLVATTPAAHVVCNCGRKAQASMSTRERVHALREAGLVPAAIADLIGLSETRVRRLLRQSA